MSAAPFGVGEPQVRLNITGFSLDALPSGHVATLYFSSILPQESDITFEVSGIQVEPNYIASTITFGEGHPDDALRFVSE